MTDQGRTGRVNQKERTRRAIVAAAVEAISAAGEVTMPEVARRALVSEATAYRYFPDLASLLREALGSTWADPAQVMEPVAQSDDPVERVGFAAEVLLREVLAYQGAIRVMISAAITKPAASLRPGRRSGLIDEALRPLNETMAVQQPAQFEQLKRGLAVVMSAEAFFILTDLCGLTAEAAAASAAATARSLTAAALATTVDAAVDAAVDTASRLSRNGRSAPGKGHIRTPAAAEYERSRSANDLRTRYQLLVMSVL